MSFLDELFSLSGRCALVTGAARGNGRAMATALGRAGATLVLVDRDVRALRDTAAALQGEGLVVEALTCDLADPDAIAELVRSVARGRDSLEILVNNAGVTIPQEPGAYGLDAWERTVAVNLRAPFLVTQALLPSLERSGRASVINVTSLNAELAFPGNPAYAASKGGLRQLTKAMALDLGPRGIRVNALAPGYIRTAMTEASWNDPARRTARAERTILGRWGQPEDLVGAVIFLASDASAYVTGTTLYVDGGWLAKGL